MNFKKLFSIGLVSLALIACNKKAESAEASGDDIASQKRMPQSVVENAHKEADLELNCEDLFQSRMEIAQKVKKYHGQIVSENLSVNPGERNFGRLEISVRNDTLEYLLGELAKQDKLTHMSLSAVSQKSEQTQVQQQLNRVDTTSRDSTGLSYADSLVLQKQQIMQSIEYGTISVSLQTDKPRQWGFIRSFKNSLDILVDSAGYAINVLAFLLPFGLLLVVLKLIYMGFRKWVFKPKPKMDLKA